MGEKIKLKGIIWEDLINYKKIGTTLMFPKCSFKCDTENGVQLCQNRGLAAAPSQWHDIDDIMDRYMHTDLSEAIILQGLEPLDSLLDVYIVAAALKEWEIKTPLIIYTGYKKSEISPTILRTLSSQIPGDFIMKWGRYIPNQSPHYDPVLGVMLASDNQYGEYIKYE